MKERIKYLLEQFEKDNLSVEETLELLTFVNEEEDEVGEEITAMITLEELSPSALENDAVRWEGLLDSILAVDRPRPVKKIMVYPMVRWAIAAMILAVLSLGLYFYRSPVGEPKQQISKYAADVKPGGNKAVLKLADGSEISLTDAENGTLSHQSGITITKTADGQVVYSAAAVKMNSTNQINYNVISTPRGGQYQINLPDGTRVWMNAASSLKFPQAFTGLKERSVELTGEAYFEVAKNKQQPFKVHTGLTSGERKQTIEVLGTHFNVNAYADEHTTRTTLLEGSIRLNNETTLHPGEQAALSGRRISVTRIDTEEAVAWKNGYFLLNNEDIYSIMRKISRWYNVEVVYSGKITDNTFIGTVSRSGNISEVLDILELTGTVHFKIEGRRITVMP